MNKFANSFFYKLLLSALNELFLIKLILNKK